MEEEAENAFERGSGEAPRAPEPEADVPFPEAEPAFAETIGRKATRKLRAKRQKRPAWDSLGLFGTVGWSVAIPTLIGVFLGQWLDTAYPEEERSWTLICLMSGLCVGCVNAWLWVGRENALNKDYKEEMRREFGQEAGGSAEDGEGNGA